MRGIRVPKRARAFATCGIVCALGAFVSCGGKSVSSDECAAKPCTGGGGKPGTGGKPNTGGKPGTGGAPNFGGYPGTGAVPSYGGVSGYPSYGGAAGYYGGGGYPSYGGYPGGGGYPSDGGYPGYGGVAGYPGYGGYPGGGGYGGAINMGLGRACAVDAECGQGLQCIRPNSGAFDGEGPAKGYCTTSCIDDSTCAQIKPGANCHELAFGKGFCFEGCQFGPNSLTAFDPKKCHGRQEVACTPVYDASGALMQGECAPRCNAHTDCGFGLKCSPRTGFCTTVLPTGKDLGESCTVAGDSGVETCKGNCVEFESGATTFGACAQGCTMGAQPSCGWGGPGTGPAPATCLFTESVIVDKGGPGLGDYGLCGLLCDCNSQCKTSGFVCHAWEGPNAIDLKYYFGRSGYCSPSVEPDGGIDPGISTCGGDGG